MRGSFSDPRHAARREALAAWHAELENDRGARAGLRRARSPEDVLFQPIFYRLLARIQAAQPLPRMDDPRRRRNLAALAGLAARVRQNNPSVPLARQMGAADDRRSAAGPRVSEARFRRLLATSSLDDRYLQLARVIQLLDQRIDLASLADALCDWEDDPDLRQRWAYDYYQASLS